MGFLKSILYFGSNFANHEIIIFAGSSAGRSSLGKDPTWQEIAFTILLLLCCTLCREVYYSFLVSLLASVPNKPKWLSRVVVFTTALCKRTVI